MSTPLFPVTVVLLLLYICYKLWAITDRLDVIAKHIGVDTQRETLRRLRAWGVEVEPMPPAPPTP